MTMLKKSDPNLSGKLDKKFHDHPLLLTCRQTFRHYMASMDFFDYTSEELFIEAANVIDTIFNAPLTATDYLNDLWDNTKIKLKGISSTTPPQGDLDKVCGVLFYVVAATLSLHWREYYNTEIVSLLCEIVEHKGIFTDTEEHKTIIDNLCRHAEGLDVWINQYGESDIWLSEEIEKYLSRKQPVVKKDEKKDNLPDYSRYSFLFTPPKKYKGKETQLLDYLYNELKDNGFIEVFEDLKLNEFAEITDIDDKNKIIFNAIFSGADTDYHVVWKKTKVELRYFIKQLKERGVLSWKKGPRIWQVTRNRIWYRKTDFELSETTGTKHPKYEFVQFGEHDLDKGNTPANTVELDRILDFIAPPDNKPQNTINKEIHDTFHDYSDYEQKHENERARMLSNGYRDTSH